MIQLNNIIIIKKGKKQHTVFDETEQRSAEEEVELLDGEGLIAKHLQIVPLCIG